MFTLYFKDIYRITLIWGVYANVESGMELFIVILS